MNEWYVRRGKRVFDVIGAAFVLSVVALPMLLIALAIRWRMGGPVIFRQVRPGLHGQPFTILKFRTMSDERDATGPMRPDAERLTALGRGLRRTSLDELPELWNVLRGDMSLVGPRPLLPEYLPYYTAEEQRRHEVRPGLTGLAQIHGRNTLEWDRRLGADIDYVDHRSATLDVRILLATLQSVLQGQGVAVDSRAAIRRLSEVRRERNEPLDRAEHRS
jgi:lipopolysaccharide/colanic/teichoic acid biosynthesis glycosyltransferase